MKAGLPSVARDFNTLGYETVAIHPYYGAEWRRTQNYELLDFNKFIFGQTFMEQGYDAASDNTDNITDPDVVRVNFGDDLEYIRGFVSDAECYRRIVSEMNSINENEKNAFIFCVTIQNHGGYGSIEDDFTPDVYCRFEDEDVREIFNEYLTSISISDSAFGDFIGEMREYPKRTIVIMFGDHQPGIAAPGMLRDKESTIPINAQDFIVPYILWANYDIEWEVSDLISINYLSALVKQAAGFPLRDWDKIRLKAYEYFPALSRYFAVDSQGEFVSQNDVINESVLRDYRIAQYAALFENF